MNIHGKLKTRNTKLIKTNKNKKQTKKQKKQGVNSGAPGKI